MAEEKETKGIQMMELRGITHMLKATASMAEDMMVWKSADQECTAGVRQYNAVVKRLGDFIPGNLFIPLGEDASLIDLGMCCRQMASYLEGMVEELTPDKSRVNVILPNAKGDLKELGEVIRQAMPAWFKEQTGGERPKGENAEVPENNE